MNWWVLKHKIHVSWLITICCLFLVFGVYISTIFNGSNLIFLIFGLVFIVIGLRFNIVLFIPMIIIGSLTIGSYRGSISLNESAKLSKHFGKVVNISGKIADEVDIDASGKSLIHLSNLKIYNQNINTKIWVSADVSSVSKGDRLLLNGKLSNGFGNYAGKVYQARITKIIKPASKNIAAETRDLFVGAIKSSIKSEPESSLGVGYLVGQRQLLPADFVLALQAAGLTHVVVASGYNLTILVRLARRLFEKTSKYLSALSSGLMIVCFIAITGISPSMSRAGLVSGLSLLAWYYGRRFHPIVLISIAMAVTVMINPSYAWGDLGWQLSFAAFAGVLILAPLMSRYFFGEKKINFIGQVLIETVSAQILTAPLIIASFGQISNIAIIANLLVLPLVPLAMLFTFIAGLCQIIVPYASVITAVPAEILLKYMVGVTNFFSELPWAISNVQFGAIGVLILYLLITLFCFYLWRVTKYNLRDVNLVE
jgi:competence protein ComEC